MLNCSEKIKYAHELINKCKGKKGVWASSNRYKNQCWTRDFCLTICPLLLRIGTKEDIELVESHLNNIANRMTPNGKVPILFLDDEKEFLRDKIKKAIEKGAMPFMLQRYLDNEVENLTPHTRDSEMLFIIAVTEFLQKTGTVESPLTMYAQKAMQYVHSQLKDNLILGADWRDTREDLDNKPVLTNTCLLYKAYECLGYNTHKESIKKIIQERYWNGTYFRDYPESESFDILGNSLSVLYDIASKDQRESIFKYAMNNLSTPFGFKLSDTFLPPLNIKEKEIMARDQSVIWPFVSGFLLSAMITKGGYRWYDISRKEFNKWTALTGFYEWYDIVEGNGYGSEDQIWSAAIYLKVRQDLSDYIIT